eukprot:TRINITY_DN4371_c0_g1_i1.p1 TRINITY_DN4371_c0_g1~~TRINITY_DN4371_c0_g1_i1.p1  ORF type:complete len:309 (-),score=68.83 TRINITY_DN4371_c0_g1_i1:70-996(-)
MTATPGQIIWYKIAMMVSIIVSSVVMGFLPLVFDKSTSPHKRLVLSLGNTFAGGVFLAIGYLHLLAEANDMMSEIYHHELHFPLAFLLSIAGFMVTFFIEKVVFSHAHGGHGHDEENYVTFDEKKEYGAADKSNLSGSYELLSADGLMKKKGIFIYLLTAVLSIHSVISGVAMGMETEFAALLSLFIAIISHKWIEAFALGVAIQNSHPRVSRMVKLILMYSAMEPVGIVIGIILSLKLEENSLLFTQAYILSIASGTFIYVAVVDILMTEFANSEHKYMKFVSLLVGMSLVIALILSISHEHSHDDE